MEEEEIVDYEIFWNVILQGHFYELIVVPFCCSEDIIKYKKVKSSTIIYFPNSISPRNVVKKQFVVKRNRFTQMKTFLCKIVAKYSH